MAVWLPAAGKAQCGAVGGLAFESDDVAEARGAWWL